KSPGWHLHIVGSQTIDPTYSSNMRHLGETLGISHLLTWHGRLSDHELACLYAAGDLLVMPSYEGFGIVYLDAMSYGLPVLAANIGAAPEIISPGINGYLIAPDDISCLTGYLDCLLSNRVQLATLAYHARLHYEGHPTWEKSMHDAYQWLREKSGVGRH